jgi:DNA-directed RNA polymerase subunit H (RpoH/RPB5)
MLNDYLRCYHISRENALDILRFRNYNISDDYNMTREEFCEMYENMDISDIKADISNTFEKGKEKTLITWHSEPKLGVTVRDTVKYMEENDINKAIIIVDVAVTSNCKDILKNVKITKGIIIDVWTLQESMIFSPDHMKVDPHRLLSTREKIDIMKIYGKDKTKYPIMKPDDIMVRYLGAVKGQMVEVMKTSDTNPDYQILEYRYVR